MVMDELTMLSFVGIYILLLGSFLYSFYQSKKLYQVLDDMVEIISIVAELKIPGKEGTMTKLISKGLEIEDAREEF